MNSLKTLYFPATDIYSIRQYPIFLLFQNIHIIQPVEKDPASSDDECTDTFIKSGFCQVDTPSPLGQDRSRFLHLVQDIEKRKDNYAEQLSALTLAGMSHQENSSEKSDRAIMNELLTPKDLKQDDLEQDHQAKLWQARLVLAIGEILDREEEEIAANLASLDDETTSLFKELQGESDDLEDTNLVEALNQIEQSLGGANKKTMKKRLLAWKTLFQQSSLTDADILLTTSRDAGDFVINSYEKLREKPVLVLQGLTLPRLIATAGERAVTVVNEFTTTNKNLLEPLYQQLDKLREVTVGEDSLQQANDALGPVLKQWRDGIEQAFPMAEHGRIEAQICVFPEMDCSDIFGLPDSGGSKNAIVIIID